MIKCPNCNKETYIEHDTFNNSQGTYCYKGSHIECECGVRGPLASIPMQDHFILNFDDPVILEADKQAEELWDKFIIKILMSGYVH